MKKKIGNVVVKTNKKMSAVDYLEYLIEFCKQGKFDVISVDFLKRQQKLLEQYGTINFFFIPDKKSK